MDAAGRQWGSLVSPQSPTVHLTGAQERTAHGASPRLYREEQEKGSEPKTALPLLGFPNSALRL